ncbi:MAG: M48 family metalloprotease [Planctomycetes bacterium]|nr:M48 family metalloprotease [Planctomycetota bacterium]
MKSVFVVLVLALSFHARAQSGRADLSVTVETDGSTHGSLLVPASSPDPMLIEGGLRESFGLEAMEVESRGKWRVFAIHGTLVVERSRLGAKGTLELGKLASVLADEALDQIVVRLSLPDSGFHRCRLGGQDVPITAELDEFAFVLRVGANVTVPRVEFEFGWSRSDLWTAASVLAVLFIAPLGLTFLARRRALRSTRPDDLRWFRFQRLRARMDLAIWIGWMAGAWFTNAPEILDWFIPGGGSFAEVVVILAYFLIPPMLIMIACEALAGDVPARLRDDDWTRRDAARDALWRQLRFVLPLACLAAAGTALEHESFRIATLLAVLAYVVYRVVTRFWIRTLAPSVTELVVGDLRDRVVEFAGRIGVHVRRVFVARLPRRRIANAMVLPGRIVVITDHLIRGLSRRETDFVLAHELAHIRRRHLLALRIVGVIAVLVVFGIAIGIAKEEAVAKFVVPVGITALLVALFTIRFASRRIEFAADTHAVTLTGDPEAAICGLVRLMRESGTPLEWGWFESATLTHPSTVRRIRAIASRAGLTDERLKEILAAAELRSSEPPYDLPKAIDSGDTVFSTEYRSHATTRRVWIVRLTIALVPALLALGVAHSSLNGLIRWTAFGLGVPLTFGAFLLASSVATTTGNRKLVKRMRAKLSREGIDVDQLSGEIVGYAPEAEPRIYGNFYYWDCGVVFGAGARLYFIGEEEAFALERAKVVSIQSGSRAGGWLRVERVFVTWLEAPGGPSRTLACQPVDGRSIGDSNRRARELAARVEEWRLGATSDVGVPERLLSLGPPSGRAVTSLSLREVVRPLSVAVHLVQATGVALIAAALLGLSFDPASGGEALVAVSTTTITAFMQLIPFWRYRDRASTAKPAARGPEHTTPTKA